MICNSVSKSNVSLLKKISGKITFSVASISFQVMNPKASSYEEQKNTSEASKWMLMRNLVKVEL